MSRIFRCSFSWLLWLLPCYSLAQDVSLAYGDQAFPPYQMGQGRLTDIEPGLAIDVVLQTAQMLGIQVQLQRMPVKRLLHELELKHLDGAIGYSFTVDRAEYLAYPPISQEGTDLPDPSFRLYRVSYYLFSRPDFIPHGLGHGLDGLKQYRIGVLKESAIAGILFQQGIPYEATRTAEQNLEKLKMGRLDLVVGPGEPTGRLIRSLGWQNEIRRSGESLLERDYFLVFSKVFCQNNASVCEQWWQLIRQHRDSIVKQRIDLYP